MPAVSPSHFAANARQAIHGKLVLQRTPVDIHAVLEETIRIMGAEAASKNIGLKLELTTARSNTSADAVWLEQVFSASLTPCSVAEAVSGMGAGVDVARFQTTTSASKG